jgi:ATP-binding cassette subfamily B protein
VFEVVSLGSVLPFLGILVAPERVFSHPLATGVVQSLGITSADQLVLPLTLTFILVTLVAAGVRISLLWVSTRFANAAGKDFSVEIYQRTLYQPYSIHVNRNSSGMISAITQKINTVVGALFYILVGVSSIAIKVNIMATNNTIELTPTSM